MRAEKITVNIIESSKNYSKYYNITGDINKRKL
jgi:hypothetical protein